MRDLSGQNKQVLTEFPQVISVLITIIRKILYALDIIFRELGVQLYPSFFVYNFFMEKFTLINKDRSRIKVFEPFEDVSKPSPSIDAMMISYGCVYKRSSKPVMKGSRVETVETARKEYAELLKEGWKKTSIFNSYF